MQRTVLLALPLILASTAAAQSRTTAAYTAAGNPNLFGYGYSASGTGDYVEVDNSMSWTGMDSSGELRTMTLDGFASAQSNFGRLRTSLDATVTNTYYNSENAPYYTGTGIPDDAGSPERLSVISTAGFEDVLAFGGGIQAGYKASYRFFIDGFSAGDNVSANLRCTIGDNPFEFYDVDLTQQPIAQYWSTKAYPVSALFEQKAVVSFTNLFSLNTYDYADGETITGSANFLSTITLDAILIYDQNDNLVSNVSVRGASGTEYSAVPEPASMAALGLGAIGLLRRRRKLG